MRKGLPQNKDEAIQSLVEALIIYDRAVRNYDLKQIERFLAFYPDRASYAHKL